MKEEKTGVDLEMLPAADDEESVEAKKRRGTKERGFTKVETRVHLLWHVRLVRAIFIAVYVVVARASGDPTPKPF